MATFMAPSNETQGKYLLVNPYAPEFLVCYKEDLVISNNIWQKINPLSTNIPIFLTQLCPLVFLIRFFMLLLKPARQPRFMAELLTSVVLGATVVGAYQPLNDALNPFEGAMIVEVMANLGLTYYMFVVGLEMDLTPVWNSGKTAFYIALTGVIFPLVIGYYTYQLLVGANENKNQKPPAEGAIFWCIALTVTSFSDLARLLSEFKLLHTELGKIALTAATMNDVTSWILLVGSVSYLNGRKSMYMMLPTLLFIIFFWVVLRPLLICMINGMASKKQISGEGKYTEKHIIFILSIVPFFGFLSDVCGAHSMIGAFLFGLVIPPGELGTMIMEGIEEYVTGIMLPPIFLTIGFRTNFRLMAAGYSPYVMATVIIINLTVKLVPTTIVSLFLGSTFSDSSVLGVLMNTKGVLSIIILNEGRNLKAFDQQTFAAMICSIFIMTGLVGPILSYTHKLNKNAKRFYLKSIEKCKPETELRILLGVHSTSNASSLLNLLQISNAHRKVPITAFALHLVELTGRASAMLIFHERRPKSNIPGAPTNTTREKAEAENIMTAFENFELDNPAVSIQPLTAVSSYDSMHEDISNFALDKRVMLILVPFHRQPTVDGGWKDDNLQLRQVNQNLLETAPCSVGIFIDRGLKLNFDHNNGIVSKSKMCRIAMFFIGGPDDREALAYAFRMAGSENVLLTVVRFYPGEEAADVVPHDRLSNDEDPCMFTAMMETEMQQEIDAEYINEFRFKIMYTKSITLVEKQVNFGDETMSAIASEYDNFDLYVVGRGHGSMSPLMAGLSVWSEFPELGALGEAIVSSEFIQQSSVLVVQQSSPLLIESKKRFEADFESYPQTFVNHRKKNDDYF